MKRGRKESKVYKFSLEGNLICSYDSIKQASEKTGISECTLRSGISRNTCVNLKWYFSYSDKLTLTAKKSEFNPLLSKGGRGMKDVFRNEDYLDEEEI